MPDAEDIAAALAAATGQPIGLVQGERGATHVTVGGVVIDDDDPPSFADWRQARGFGEPCSMFPMGCEHPEECGRMGAACGRPADPEEAWRSIDFDQLQRAVERNRRRGRLRRARSRIVQLACAQAEQLPEPLASAVAEFIELRKG